MSDWENCPQCHDEFMRRPMLQSKAAMEGVRGGQSAARAVVDEAMTEYHAEHSEVTR